MNSLDAAREELERVRAQRDHAWDALKLTADYEADDYGYRSGFYCGLVDRPEDNPHLIRPTQGYADGRQVAAVLAEAKEVLR